MGHILKRHHPDFWDGSSKASRTFFDQGMGVDDVADVITSVMKQNSDRLLSRGNLDTFQIDGIVDGVKYVVGIAKGRIGQAFPVY